MLQMNEKRTLVLRRNRKMSRGTRQTAFPYGIPSHPVISSIGFEPANDKTMSHRLSTQVDKVMLKPLFFTQVPSWAVIKSLICGFIMHICSIMNRRRFQCGVMVRPAQPTETAEEERERLALEPICATEITGVELIDPMV